MELTNEQRRDYSLHSATNQYRRYKNVQPLTLNNKIYKAAAAHTTWMAANKILSHTGKGGSSFTQRLVSKGYTAGCGENVLYNYQDDVCAILTQWINSSGHEKNMRSPSAKSAGMTIRFIRGKSRRLLQSDVNVVSDGEKVVKNSTGAKKRRCRRCNRRERRIAEKIANRVVQIMRANANEDGLKLKKRGFSMKKIGKQISNKAKEAKKALAREAEKKAKAAVEALAKEAAKRAEAAVLDAANKRLHTSKSPASLKNSKPRYCPHRERRIAARKAALLEQASLGRRCRRCRSCIQRRNAAAKRRAIEFKKNPAAKVAYLKKRARQRAKRNSMMRARMRKRKACPKYKAQRAAIKARRAARKAKRDAANKKNKNNGQKKKRRYCPFRERRIAARKAKREAEALKKKEGTKVVEKLTNKQIKKLLKGSKQTQADRKKSFQCQEDALKYNKIVSPNGKPIRFYATQVFGRKE